MARVVPLGRIYRNEAEDRCAVRLRRRGYEATKSGWPDFLVFRPDGSLVVVEVKRQATHRLKVTQARVFAVLLRAGIECYRFDPDAGFRRLRVTPSGRVTVCRT